MWNKAFWALFAALEVQATPQPLKDDFLDPQSAGAGTVQAQGVQAFSLPAKNASPAHRRDFVVGNSFFKENWIPAPSSVPSRQGLGPYFNAPSCSSCHFKDGRAAPPLNENEEPVGLLFRLSGKDHKPLPFYGDQLHPHAVSPLKANASVRVGYRKIRGQYPDGQRYTLLQPEVRMTQLAHGDLPAGTQISPRIAPQLVGVGLLEAIGEADILALADPHDRNGDGISGRPNRVWDIRASRKRLGRFGWKANQPHLHQQNAAAFVGDMGITSELFPSDNCATQDTSCLKLPTAAEPEISSSLLRQVTIYTKLLAVPARRNVGVPRLLRGRDAFAKVGCLDCHVSTYVTGVDPELPENSGQLIHPYTDLLLHDMGPGLADGRADFLANGSEWRTPPLWGLGLIEAVNGHTRLLHDGRARSIEEAILWHGGEALRSQRAFQNLPASSRQELIEFVESL